MIIKFPKGGRDNINMALNTVTISELNDMIAAAQHEPEIVRKLEQSLRIREGDKCFVSLNLMLELVLKCETNSKFFQSLNVH